MPNNRLISSCLGLFIDSTFLSGVQAVGINPTQEAESVKDIGRSQPFAVLYNKPAVEITVERVVGSLSPFFYQPAVKNTYADSYILKPGNIGLCGWDGTPLKNYLVELYFGADTLSYLGADSGPSIGKLTTSKCLLTGIQYNLNISGSVTETLSFESNNLTRTFSSAYPTLPSFNETAQILRRQHVLVGDASFVLPTEVSMTFDNGFATGSDIKGKYVLQDIALGVKIDYSELIDTGKWRGSDTLSEQNRWKYVNIPILSTASFRGLGRDIFSHSINVSDVNFMSTAGTPDRQIRILAQLGSNYYVWDLGEKNYLTNLTKDGGESDGGNVFYTFEYANSNNDFVPYIDSSVHTLSPTKY